MVKTSKSRCCLNKSIRKLKSLKIKNCKKKSSKKSSKKKKNCKLKFRLYNNSKFKRFK